jgi:poly(A) polymerase Pap1
MYICPSRFIIRLIVCIFLQGIPACRGLLRTFGSYRLGVHATDADIDALVIGPSAVGRDLFFADFAARLRAHPSAACVRCIPDAFMPLIKCQLGGVDVDLLYAAVPAHVLPADRACDEDEEGSSSSSSSASSANSNSSVGDNASSSAIVSTSTDGTASSFCGTSGGDPCALLLDDAALLQSLDAQSCRALNGPRVNEAILALVPDVRVFQTVLRCVKLWARRTFLAGSAVLSW